MNRSSAWLAFAGLVLCSFASVQADIPPFRGGGPPRPQPRPVPNEPPPAGPQAEIEVTVDQAAAESRLEVPRRFVNAEAPLPNAVNERPSQVQTVAVGTSLSLGIVAAFLAWRRRSPRAVLAGAIVLALATVGAGLAMADLAPFPKENRPIVAWPAGMKVRVVVVPNGDKVRLVLGKADAGNAFGKERGFDVPTAPAAVPAKK
jgi:hypothetical protein